MRPDRPWATFSATKAGFQRKPWSLEQVPRPLAHGSSIMRLHAAEHLLLPFPPGLLHIFLPEPVQKWGTEPVHTRPSPLCLMKAGVAGRWGGSTKTCPCSHWDSQLYPTQLWPFCLTTFSLPWDLVWFGLFSKESKALTPRGITASPGKVFQKEGG